VKKEKDYALILDGKKIEGIVTLKDVLSQVNKGADLKKTSMKSIMSPRVVCFNPGTLLYEGMEMAVTRRFNQLPIVVEKELQGIVDLRSMVKVYYDYISEIQDVKNDILVRPVLDLDSV